MSTDRWTDWRDRQEDIQKEQERFLRDCGWKKTYEIPMDPVLWAKNAPAGRVILERLAAVRYELNLQSRGQSTGLRETADGL